MVYQHYLEFGVTPSTPSKLSLDQTLFFASVENVERQAVVDTRALESARWLVFLSHLADFCQQKDWSGFSLPLFICMYNVVIQSCL